MYLLYPQNIFRINQPLIFNILIIMPTLNKFLSFAFLILFLIFKCNSNKKEVLNLPEGLSIVSAVSDRKMAEELSKSNSGFNNS